MGRRKSPARHNGVRGLVCLIGVQHETRRIKNFTTWDYCVEMLQWMP